MARGAPAVPAAPHGADLALLRDRAADRGMDRPGRPHQRLLGGAPRRGGDRRAQRDPPADHRCDPAAADARLRLPRDPRGGRPDAPRRRRHHRRAHERRRVLVGAPRRVPRLRRDARDRGRRRGRRRQRVLVSASSSASRARRERRSARTRRVSSSSRSTGSRCRCCAARCATATPHKWRAGSPRTTTR